MNKASLYGATALAALLSAAAPEAVRAQTAQPPGPAENANEVEAVVVTARKREEQIQDVPAVVSAVTGQLADDLGGLTNARDLTALLPGVTFIESAQGPTAEPNIRGAGQARLPNSDAAIGLYRNGAYIVGGNLGGRTLQRFDTFDMQRTEVLRGPQGALYGRNAVGGAINVISRQPSFTTDAELTFLAGSQDAYGLQAIVNLPLSETVALRGGIDVEKQDGGFYRTAAGEVADEESYAAGRLSIRFRPTDALNIVLLGDYSNEDGFAGTSISRVDPDGDPFLINEGTVQTRSAQQYNLSLNIDFDLGAATATSVTNYRNRQSAALLDADGGRTLNELNFFDDDAETFFQEVRLVGESNRLNWLVGADLFYLHDIYFNNQSGRAIVPATMTMAAVNPNFTQTTDYKQRGYAAFGSAEFEVTDALSVEAEARYSVDEKDLSIVALRADGTPRYTDFPPNSPASNPTASFENVSYGVTGSYRVSEDILAFLRASTAYRAGGFNSELGNPCGPGEVPGTSCNLVDVPPTYDEEHSITYELGVKTSWFDDLATLNVNIYNITYEDILANFNNGIMPMVDPLNGAMFLDNAGEASAWGFEIEMSARPVLPDAWGTLSVAASLSKQEGEFETIAPGLTTIQSGFNLARLRPWSATANFVYRYPIGSSLRLLVAANYFYETGGFQNAENTFSLDDVERLNGRIALESDKWEIALQGRNILDSQYFTNQGGTAVGGLGSEYRLNDPRSYRVTFTVRY